MSVSPGTLVGPYEIISRIGAGGMGEVWKARDPRQNRFVAIKFGLWSPDDRTIVFRSDGGSPGDLYRKPADGSRSEELLYADNLTKSPTSLSSNGKYLAYFAFGDPKTGVDIWVLPNPLGPAGSPNHSRSCIPWP